MTTAASETADLVIRGASLIDGTGAPAVPGDIAIRGERIVAMGDLSRWRGGTEIAAGGRAVAPGFIDVHTHDDRAVLVNPTMDCKVSQGVTTVVVGNCGLSLAPLQTDARPPAPMDLVCERADGYFPSFAGYLDRLDAEPPAPNVLAQVGHSSLRVGAMGAAASVERPASAREIEAMCARLDRSLGEGAIGLSTGLFYPPANPAPTDEVIALARVLTGHGAIHTTHIRDETDGIAEAMEEGFAIGRAAHVPVVFSHHKCAGAANHGRSRETLALFDKAMRQQEIGLDCYPYVAGSSMLGSGKAIGATRVLVSWSDPHPEFAGRDLDAVAAEMGLDRDAAVEALLPAGGIFFAMAEEDVNRILAYPHTMIGSDGLPHDKHPHPRLWGCFPRVLGHCARALGLFSMEEAVRRMTGLPARRFGIPDRGVLREGAFADLVLFDPQTVADTATFEAPISPAAGIDLVMVAGRAVWRDGAATGARPGRAIRLQALQRAA